MNSSAISPSDRPLALRLFLALLLLYAALSGAHLYTMDDHTNFHVADALLSRGSIDLEEISRARHLNTTVGTDGRRYSYYGIGGPLVYLPFVALGRGAGALVGSSHYLAQACMSLASAVFTAAAASVIFLVLRRRGRSSRRAIAAALLYALATPALVWSKYSANSVIVGFLFIAAFACLETSRRGWLAAGLLLGLAVNVRYDAAIGAALLPAVAAARGEGSLPERMKRLVPFVIALVPFAVLLLGHNQLRFGSPWRLGYSNLASAEPFGTPLLTGLYGLLLSPNRGLFFHAPVLFALPWAFRRGIVSRWHLLLPAAYAVFFAKAETWDGGVTWGPRYLGCVLPLLCLPLGDAVAELAAAGRGKAVIALAAASTVLQLWGGIASMDSYHDFLVESGVNPLRTRDEIVLAPVWGVRHVMRGFTLERIPGDAMEGALPAGGHPATRILRATPDFWPFYACKMGLPAVPLALLWLALAAGSLIIFRGVLQAALGDPFRTLS